MSIRRGSSTDSAARFFALRSKRRRAERAEANHKRLERASAPRRIYLDFAEPTLRAIHEALLYRLEFGNLIMDTLNITIIAEQMVGAALGDPPAWPDEPPLTDREAP